MKLTTGILALTLTAGGIGAQATAQNTDAIDNARSVAKSLQQKQTVDSNTALGAAGTAQPDKPTPGAPAPAVKPAVIPGSQSASASTPAAKPAAAPAAKSASASSAHNQLQHVSVTPGSDSIEIELSSTEAVTPRVSKLSSPARILVELPETVSAAPQNHIAVGSGGVKGLRIGTDGKTPPTTSVVVDLEKAIAYDIAPGAAGKLILTLHADGSSVASAKSTPAPAKSSAPSKSTTQTAPAVIATAKAAKDSSAAKTVSAKSAPAASASAPATSAAKTSAPTLSSASGKPATASALKTAVATKETAAKEDTKTVAIAAPALPASKPAGSGVSAMQAPDAKPKQEDKKWAMNGKRDPFFSPVVQQPSGSGCSTGKKCLEIGNINLRGVVKSDSGFIAVVTNSLNKAYFLRENDPVFNGYVMKITGDSVVFQETVEDKLGKPFTREVVKRIFTPAV
jgi:AMIN domain